MGTDYPIHCTGVWEETHPDLIAGMTGHRPGDAAGSGSDFGLATGGTAWQVAERYEALATSLGMESAVVARQVHGARVVWLEAGPESGLHVVGPADGLITRSAGVLLVVTAADCVPVYLTAGDGQTVCLLHAGWRGAAADLLETGLDVLSARGVPTETVRVHLGPAICGACYDVGSEVLEALGHPPAARGRIDLRDLLVERAKRAGVPADSVTRSTVCTGCGSESLFSHRRQGDAAGRMAAFLGRKPVSGADPAASETSSAGLR